MMKAFVSYDKTGQVTSVAVPNPEFGDHLRLADPDDGSVMAIDITDVVKDAKRLTFAVGEGKPAGHLQEAMRTIAEQYRVDPSTRRLGRKDHRGE
jgi:hypothetical protein